MLRATPSAISSAKASPVAGALRMHDGVEVLQPMGSAATKLGPAVRALGRWGTKVETGFNLLAPLMMVALNPTNRLPG
jgi:hypothetical protein